MDHKTQETQLTDRFNRIDNQSGRSKSFIFVQILLAIIIFSPIFAVISGILLEIVLPRFSIQFDFLAYIMNFIAFSLLILGILVLYYYIFLIFFIIMTLTTYKRTKYIGFLFESLIEIQLLVSPIIIGLIYLFIKNDLFISFIYIVFVLIEYSLIKKPLIYGSKYQYWPFPNKNDANDIISHQTAFINDFEDGYSPRPVIKIIKDLIPTGQNTPGREKLIQFAQFLAINGDLIGYTVDDFTLKMFLRTRFIQKTQIFNPFVTIRKFKEIMKMGNLTTVTVNFETLEISFKMNNLDYAILGNITFYQLSERVLQQFMTSIKEFLEEQYQESYDTINPDIITKNSIFYNRPRVFFVIGYIIYSLILSSIFILFSPPQSTISFLVNSNESFVVFILWPMFIIAFLQTINQEYNGNVAKNLTKEFEIFLLVAIGVIIALILTIIIFYLVYYLRSKYFNRNIKIFSLKTDFDVTREDKLIKNKK